MISFQKQMGFQKTALLKPFFTGSQLTEVYAANHNISFQPITYFPFSEPITYYGWSGRKNKISRRIKKPGFTEELWRDLKK